VGNDAGSKWRFAYYQVGPSAIATNAFSRKVGIEAVTLPPPSGETITRGVSYAPEFSCFPFKVLLGLLLQGIDRGVNVFVVPTGTSVNACQLADFGMAQKYILKRTGYDVDIILLDGILPNKVLESFRNYKPDISLRQVSEGLIVAAQKLSLLERVADRSRDIYLSAGKKKAEGFYRAWTRKVDGTDSILDLYALGGEMEAEWGAYPTAEPGKFPRIAVIGDIYSINERMINNNIFERLCDLNVYPENGMKLSMLFIAGIGFDAEDQALSRKARKYLRHNIGGFARDTVKSAIRYAGMGYDGLIHIYPFGCMAEVAVRNILPRIGEDCGIPILHLPIDEQSGDAGFTTRIEAFVDLIDIRRRKAKIAANG